MKGVLDINMEFLIFLIVILVVVAVFISLLVNYFTPKKISTGCVNIFNSIASIMNSINPFGSSEKARLPNALWC